MSQTLVHKEEITEAASVKDRMEIKNYTLNLLRESFPSMDVRKLEITAEELMSKAYEEVERRERIKSAMNVQSKIDKYHQAKMKNLHDDEVKPKSRSVEINKRLAFENHYYIKNRNYREKHFKQTYPRIMYFGEYKTRSIFKIQDRRRYQRLRYKQSYQPRLEE